MGFGAFLKKSIPMLATAIPVPGVGAVAATVLGNALGVKDATVSNVENIVTTALAKDPDATMAKLREAEQSFQVRMAELGFENTQKLEEIAAADRSNARGREIAIRDKMPAVLAIGTTIGFFGILIMMTFRVVPPETREAVLIMLGSLGSAWISVITYYFGSSAGSRAKTDIMAGQK